METRDHNWLKLRLESIWQKHFPDVAIKNEVFVKFGRKSKTRLGSIKLGRGAQRHNLERLAFKNTDNPHTIITINAHMVDPEIPEFVVDAVLAHELTHYAQGFCSPHQQAFRHPHRGGVVKNEMQGRGLDELMRHEKKWVKDNWLGYIRRHH